MRNRWLQSKRFCNGRGKLCGHFRAGVFLNTYRTPGRFNSAWEVPGKAQPLSGGPRGRWRQAGEVGALCALRVVATTPPDLDSKALLASRGRATCSPCSEDGGEKGFSSIEREERAGHGGWSGRDF